MIDKDLFKLIGKEKKYIVWVVVVTVLGLFANLGITACVCRAVALAISADQNGTGFLPQTFAVPFAVALLCIVIRYFCSRAVGDLRDVLGRSVKKNLRQKVYDKILRLGSRSADELKMAGLTQVSMEGVEQLDLYFSSYIPQFFYAMLAPFILFFICVWIDWRTALVLLCCVPLIPVSIVAVSKYAKKVFAKYWGKYITMGDGFLDAVQGLRELKIFRADERQHQKMNDSAEEFRRITMKVLIMQLASTTLMDLIAYGGAGLGIALACRGLMMGYLAVPFALFLMLVAVEFFLPLRAFGSAFHVAMNGASAGKKILALLDQKEPSWGDHPVEHTDISMEHVCFSYDGTREVLHDVTARFAAKGLTAIVGESGCGKSTIVRLLMGGQNFEGRICVGGAPIETLSREAYYRRLSVVSYDTYIFNESVMDNFRLARPDVTEGQVWEALEKVNLADFIRQSGGLEKVISEDGTNLSGGEKQRLALAVSLVADRDICIFDEATSNIDIDSETVIMRNIYSMAREKNIILISHRLANVTGADRIYYLEDGQIQESGSHEELMAAGGGYAALFLEQKRLETSYKTTGEAMA